MSGKMKSLPSAHDSGNRLFTGTHTSGVTRLASATFVHEAAQGYICNYL